MNKTGIFIHDHPTRCASCEIFSNKSVFLCRYGIVLVFAAVMLNDVHKLILEWQQKDTVVKMTMMFNKTITLPPATLCIQAPLIGYSEMNHKSPQHWEDRLRTATDTITNQTDYWPYDGYLFATAYFSELAKISGHEPQALKPAAKTLPWSMY